MTSILTRGREETYRLGMTFGEKFFPPKVLALMGTLGSGKTTFVQGLAEGLGVEGPVTSPTFVLLNRYPGKNGLFLNHVDLYRLEGEHDIELLGLSEWWGGETITVIEWADRLRELPDFAQVIRFELKGNEERSIGLPSALFDFVSPLSFARVEE